MTKIPDLAEVLTHNDFPKLHASVQEKRDAGQPMEDIAETVAAEVLQRIKDGDINGADSLLFHAVHAGVRPSLLFTEAQKTSKQ